MECLDEITAQKYFDGELPPEMQQRAAAHISSCTDCAVALRVIEAETAAIGTAFACRENFDLSTERLREKLDDAISRLAAEPLPARRVPHLRGLLNWLTESDGYGMRRRRTAFASFAVLAAAVMLAVVWSSLRMSPMSTLSSGDSAPPLLAHARQPMNQQSSETSYEIPRAGRFSETNVISNAPDEMRNSSDAPRISPPGELPSGRSDPTTQTHTRPAKRVFGNTYPATALDGFLPGEKTYLEAIDSLKTAADSGVNDSLPGSLRAEYKRSLDVIDEAISATRRTAATDPTDTVAADFLREAYESKIELLSSLATQMGETRKGSAFR